MFVKVSLDNGKIARRAQMGTLTQIVAEQLSWLVAEEGLKAGDPLPSEDSLAERFAVSKRVVREALRILSAQGIVQTSQGRKAVVADSKPLAIEAYFKDRKSTRLNSSHANISYAVFC